MQTEINGQKQHKIRILAVITQAEIGGAQEFLASLGEHINPDLFEITTATGQPSGRSSHPSLDQNSKTIRLRHLKREIAAWSDIRAVVEIRRLIVQISPDILFLNSSKAGFIGSLAARLARRSTPKLKVVYRIGGWTFNDPWPRWKKLLWRILERLGARWKDVIVVNNQRDLESAEKYKIKPRQSLVRIHNGIDPYRTYLDYDQARMELFSKLAQTELKSNQGGQALLFHAPLLIGTIANLYPTKGIEILIEAIARVHAPALFVIIGDGPLMTTTQASIKEKRLERVVHLAGTIIEASHYLPAFDVFVLPSIKEGFPWAVLEAMAAKVPVIATNVGAIPEIIESGVNGLVVPPGDPETLARAIDALADDERRRQEFGIQGHQTVIRSFGLRTMIEQYEQLFQEIVGN